MSSFSMISMAASGISAAMAAVRGMLSPSEFAFLSTAQGRDPEGRLHPGPASEVNFRSSSVAGPRKLTGGACTVAVHDQMDRRSHQSPLCAPASAWRAGRRGMLCGWRPCTWGPSMCIEERNTRGRGWTDMDRNCEQPSLKEDVELIKRAGRASRLGGATAALTHPRDVH